jgi:hypothetical protein
MMLSVGHKAQRQFAGSGPEPMALKLQHFSARIGHLVGCGRY